MIYYQAWDVESRRDFTLSLYRVSELAMDLLRTVAQILWTALWPKARATCFVLSPQTMLAPKMHAMECL